MINRSRGDRIAVEREGLSGVGLSGVITNRDTGGFGVLAACRRFPEGSLLPFCGGFGRRVELEIKSTRASPLLKAVASHTHSKISPESLQTINLICVDTA